MSIFPFGLLFWIEGLVVTAGWTAKREQLFTARSEISGAPSGMLYRRSSSPHLSSWMTRCVMTEAMPLLCSVDNSNGSPPTELSGTKKLEGIGVRKHWKKGREFYLARKRRRVVSGRKLSGRKRQREYCGVGSQYGVRRSGYKGCRWKQ